MTLSTNIQPINRDIEVMLNDLLSPEAQSAAFAQYAGEMIDDAKAIDQSALGHVPTYTISVDGRSGADLASVKPDGVIVAEFEVFSDVLAWIADQLKTHSPVRHGTYQQSHVLLADGQEIEIKDVVPGRGGEYVFINSQPYARKIERGASSMAPDGVYQAVATLAAARFGNVAKITFSYRSLMGGALGSWASKTSMSHKGHATRTSRHDWLTRQPAIIVTFGDR